jgi:hypothetical protein
MNKNRNVGRAAAAFGLMPHRIAALGTASEPPADQRLQAAGYHLIVAVENLVTLQWIRGLTAAAEAFRARGLTARRS